MRACEIVLDIFANRTNVTTEDIASIREIVLNKKFGIAGLSDNGLIALVGEAFQEMRYLHKRLNVDFDNDEKAADRELWYISEWLKKNRCNNKRVKDSSVEQLSMFLGTEIYKYADGAKRGDKIWADILNKDKGLPMGK